MEQDSVFETGSISELAGVLLNPLNATVYCFSFSIGDVVDGGIDHTVKMFLNAL